MDESLLKKLLKEFKSKARITWDDNDEDLEELILESDAYLQGLTNATFRYGDEERWVKTLLLERCRYDYHNALDEFEENLNGEIKRLILNSALGKVGILNEQANP